MLFNSLQFLVFFPLVIIFFFAIPHRIRWILLLIASYYFYMSWKAEYIILILVSTLIDYYAGLKMSTKATKKERKKYLYLSIFVNLGLLFTFKYYNFFSESLYEFLSLMKINIPQHLLTVLLPIGISFYTFQTLSYSIDIYNGKIKPERHLGKFALFVSFFPQLVAGPIERAGNILPQLNKKITFDYVRVTNGLKLMAWGYFKKLVIADRLAPFVDTVYNNPAEHFGFQIILATFFFAIQIYCDFSGYSDIAIGAARIMGINLMRNFNRPYFSKSIREFWKRWHISLSTWFRDYLYFPLGGNQVVKWRWYYNLFIVFLISGLWHGANWTFLIWGALHGIYLIIGITTKKGWDRLNNLIGIDQVHGIRKFIQVISTFILVCIAWIFFRSNSVSDSFLLFKNMIKISHNQINLNILGEDHYNLLLSFLFIFILESVHFMQRKRKLINILTSKHFYIRWTIYLILMLFIINFGVYETKEFIYFQF